VRVEIISWMKFITVVWPLIGLIAILPFLVVFYRPLRRILEQFNCRDVERIKIGPVEIVKQSRPKRMHTVRRKKNQSTRQ